MNPGRKLAVSFANGFVREDRRGGLAVDVTEERLPADLNRFPPELSADLEDLNNVPQRDVMLPIRVPEVFLAGFTVGF